MDCNHKKPLGCRSIGLPYRTRNAIIVLYIVTYSCVGDCYWEEHPNKFEWHLFAEYTCPWFVILAAKKTNGIFFTMPLKKTIPLFSRLYTPLYIINELNTRIYIYIYTDISMSYLRKSTRTSYHINQLATCEDLGFVLPKAKAKGRPKAPILGAVGIQ